jgi:hypothetical protein
MPRRSVTCSVMEFARASVGVKLAAANHHISMQPDAKSMLPWRLVLLRSAYCCSAHHLLVNTTELL